MTSFVIATDEPVIQSSRASRSIRFTSPGSA
ncbi:MAG: hypothetical protein ACI91T_002864, partial [Natronomonas sp.]